MRLFAQICLALTLGILLGHAGITPADWILYAILIILALILHLHESPNEIPDELFGALCDWSGSEPSTSRLAREVDKWLKQ